MNIVYFDNAATTKIRSEVLNEMIPGSKAPKAVRACTIRFLSLGPAKT